MPLENLKPYTNCITDMPQLMHHNNHFQNNFHYGHNYQNNSIIHFNNVKNVQKLVQSINSQFSKIFISSG